MNPLEELRAAVLSAAQAVAGEELAGGLGALTVMRSARADFGDYSTNAALLLAPLLGEPPRVLAERLKVELERSPDLRLLRAEVAGPGFLNLFMADRWLEESLARLLEAGPGFGAGARSAPLRINLEFISANPTGPLHVGHARQAAYGDALARLLAFVGHDVHREYYVNDFGSQVTRLAESIRARALGEPIPPDGYQGDYVAELVDPQEARQLELEQIAPRAVAASLERIRSSLQRFGVGVDTWFSERSLHADGEGHESPVDKALAALELEGHVYRSEGALWLRTSAHGEEKDRVLIRSTGEPTYFASDVAYHQEKRQRDFDLLIDVWGADHHGYVARMHAAFQALGGDPAALELIIIQFVQLLAGGGRSSMSKRSGEFVTLDDLVAEIGVDAARWFLLARSHDTTVELDLDLARRESAENPVYYVQYAHARISSVLENAGAERVALALEEVGGAEATEPGGEGAAPASLDPAERHLIMRLLAYPYQVAEAAERRAPHRIAAFALELAQDFTAFYRDCRIVGSEPRLRESSRLALALATQRVIASALDLLGIAAPQRM